jgi:hypothetical protein
MPLTANAIPSQVPTISCPFDVANAFGPQQTLTGVGYFQLSGSPAQLDLGGAGPFVGASVSAAGLTRGMWVLNITAIDFSSNDESYKFNLLGSNDVAFGNGNVELLAMHDFAAVTAGRQIPTILGASPTIPPAGHGGVLVYVPWMNFMQRICYRYLRCYLVVGGTTPSVTVTSWITSSGNSI